MYLITCIGDILDQLKGVRYFSKINLKSRYHQVPITPSDVWKTIFKAKEGLFEWLVMPFGLANAPTNFMSLMDDISQPFTNSFVVYLGYIIDERGVHVDLAKIQVIWDWPYPTTLIELRNFLGLANFYHRFVLGFSHITWPLSQVTNGGAKEKFFWSESQQKAFTELKHHLYSTPVLALPDLQQPFKIEADASNNAIAVVLTQHEHPMAYHNETLSVIV
eukprot:PITA_04160